MDPKKLHMYVSIEDKIANKERTCIIDQCQNTAINSHVLQKNGILNLLASNGFIREYCEAPYDKLALHFKLSPITKAYRFAGLCSIHDDSIFKYIEQREIDFRSYRSNLLFSYRALLRSLRAKETNIEIRKALLEKNFTLGYFDSEFLNRQIEEGNLALKDLLFYKHKFEDHIENSSQKDFEFIAITIPHIHIYASFAFCFESSEVLDQLELLGIDHIASYLFLNILPFTNQSLLILGYYKHSCIKCKEFSEGFANQTVDVVLSKLNEILLRYPHWVCSTDFYNNHLKSRQTIIFKYTHDCAFAGYPYTMNAPINIFEKIK